jgi:predicted acetyltransferase
MYLEVTPAGIDDKPLLQRMMELYEYDFSEFEGTDLDAHACFGYPYLDHYWVEEGRHPFIIHVDGKLAGFALINRHTLLPGSQWSVAEFFVLRKYRRQGVGKQAAFRVFDQFRGAWEVAQIQDNIPAQKFWRKIIDEYTGGKFAETIMDGEDWKGVIQYFNNQLLKQS